jgi:hypothetical protein
MGRNYGLGRNRDSANDIHNRHPVRPADLIMTKMELIGWGLVLIILLVVALLRLKAAHV